MRIFAITLATAFLTCACLSAEREFTDDRLLNVCNESYYVCRKQSGCVLDNDHYVEGAFPGVGRVAIETNQRNTEVRVRIYFRTMLAAGTELLVQMFEPNCTLNKEDAHVRWTDVDVFDEAGDDRTLIFEFVANDEGEHLVEIFSDAASEYLLVVETLNEI